MPWRLYHMLDGEFRPLHDPGRGERRPQHPVRYRNLIYGFAEAVAVIEEGVPDRPVRRARRDG